MHYIIDGYNVIHRIEALRIQLVQSLEKGRTALISRISPFQARHRPEITVVFDGEQSPGASRHEPGQMKIRFSKAPGKADDLIKRLVDECPNKTDLTVVSSDMAVLHYAKASGCRLLSSEQFYQLLSEKKVTDTGDDLGKKGDPQLSRSEIRDWIDLFNSPGKVESDP